MEALGASTIEEMRAIPGEKIAEVQYTITSGDGLCWTPIVDGVLLTAPVDDAAKAGAAHDIDYMIGSTGDDIGADTRRLEYSAVYWAQNQLALGRRPAYILLRPQAARRRRGRVPFVGAVVRIPHARPCVAAVGAVRLRAGGGGLRILGEFRALRQSERRWPAALEAVYGGGAGADAPRGNDRRGKRRFRERLIFLQKPLDKCRPDCYNNTCWARVLELADRHV